MAKIFIAFIGFCILSSSTIANIKKDVYVNAGGQDTVYKYQKLKVDSDGGNHTANWELGNLMYSTLSAISYSNIIFFLEYKKKMFCPPQMNMNGGDLIRYIDSYINEHPDNVSMDDDIALIAIMSLRNKFPCR